MLKLSDAPFARPRGNVRGHIFQFFARLVVGVVVALVAVNVFCNVFCNVAGGTAFFPVNCRCGKAMFLRADFVAERFQCVTLKRCAAGINVFLWHK